MKIITLALVVLLGIGTLVVCSVAILVKQTPSVCQQIDTELKLANSGFEQVPNIRGCYYNKIDKKYAILSDNVADVMPKVKSSSSISNETEIMIINGKKYFILPLNE